MAVLSEKQRTVWGALHAFIRNRGGVVVSSPDDVRIRFSCAPASTLPKQLEQIGFKPAPMEITGPLVPKDEVLTQHGRAVSEMDERQNDVVTQMVIYEFAMPICR
ncbi:hypothetical protein [Bradyrhizobium sp. Ai1a-2]|uniref:hypothetical protein n=1 Tax=Bradyrhizobium sp. Ai1a-2 TaxID=196490 RepID=UPI00047F1D41|nr:hypothetical protein [Bradyrhizobium sp. Ai1a-2]